jgi:hypothetical protein
VSDAVAVPEYEITSTDCEKWIERFHRMSISCMKKGDSEGCKMFATVAALVERMAIDLHQEELRETFPNPLSSLIGEA